MTRARQIYYNSIFGAIGGLLGWLVVGSLSTGGWNIWLAYAFVGAGVGLFIGALIGAVEGAVIKQSPRQTVLGVLSGAVAGFAGGLLGLLLGEIGFLLLGGGLAGRSIGWLLLGLFIGIGEGIVARSRKRVSYGALGGLLAGLIGGVIYETATQFFINRSDAAQMIVSALGLILIGACIGAIIPMTIRGLSKGRLVVRSGKKRELDVSIIDGVTLGSYDGCQLYLPGDSAIAKKHARVYPSKGKFFIEDLGSTSGTFIDGSPIQPGVAVELFPGAVIMLGSTEVQLM